MYWSSNFLAVVFKKQAISQQVLFNNSYLIVFLVLTTRGQPQQKSSNFGTDLALDMLVVCSDIHDLESPLMSVVVTRTQDLASGFPKTSGVIAPDSHSGKGNPFSHQPQSGLWPGAGRKRPSVATQTLVPLNISAVVAPLVRSLLKRTPRYRSKWNLIQNSGLRASVPQFHFYRCSVSLLR